MFKKLLFTTLSVVLISFMISSTAMGQMDQERGKSCDLVLNGEKTSVDGLVTSEGQSKTMKKGHGKRLHLLVDIGGEIVRVGGIGPDQFWTDMGIERPALNENVLIDARRISKKKGREILIAMSISIDNGALIQLRDPATGCPLWQKNKEKNKGKKNKGNKKKKK